MINVIAAQSVDLNTSLGLGTILHSLLALLVCLHLLLKPRDARTSLIWIIFTITLPIVGPLSYVLFGINTVPNKGWQKQYSDSIFQKSRRGHARSRNPLVTIAEHKNSVRVTPLDPDILSLNRILDRLCAKHPLLGGNEVKILEPAERAIEAMFLAIRKAKKHIHLSTYIFEDDVIGKRLMDLLIARANDGVEIRVLYDAFGSALPSLRQFFWRHRHIPNLQLIGFSQANMFKRKFQLNLRNHRKLLIIDGTHAFTGGINFHDVYLTKNTQPGVIDYHFSIRGPIVNELQYTFLRDWYYMTDTAPEDLLIPRFFPLARSVGNSAIRLLNSGPTRNETDLALDSYFAAVNLAHRQIIIVTPYFVPPEPLILALRQAAFRGVEVKILVPSANNHPTLRLASQALYAGLLKTGVRIFERESPFIHAKAFLVDDIAAIIGSTNIDPRSLFLNYETNLLVFDADFTARLKHVVLEDFAHAHEIVYAEWRNRSRLRQFAENFFNLFHPIA